ncbi:hypothetical protein [Bacillus massiliglaciei]|uniref:hypothetical protein n=1 Tax=Bacillus massiliglaciei TaxID=1816693 RepID=UPI0018FE5564|nr:hypothetical protein [Bacillus massiliglaciei]
MRKWILGTLTILTIITFSFTFKLDNAEAKLPVQHGIKSSSDGEIFIAKLPVQH